MINIRNIIKSKDFEITKSLLNFFLFFIKIFSCAGATLWILYEISFGLVFYGEFCYRIASQIIMYFFGTEIDILVVAIIVVLFFIPIIIITIMIDLIKKLINTKYLIKIIKSGKKCYRSICAGFATVMKK